MFWRNIIHSYRTQLISIPTAITANRYVRNLSKTLLIFSEMKLYFKFSFMDDNVRLHRTRRVQTPLEEIGNIPRLFTMASKFAIAHMWDVVKRVISNRVHPSITLEELILAAQKERNKIPMDTLSILIVSMHHSGNHFILHYFSFAFFLFSKK